MQATEREPGTSLRSLAWAGWAATLAGAIWLVVWVHFLASHGTSSFDHKRTPLGLDWHDTSRFLVIALALIVFALLTVRVGRRWSAALGRYAAILGWVAAAAGLLWALGLTEWGGTGLSFAAQSAQTGASLISLGTAVGAVGTIAYGRHALLAGLLPRGSGFPLALGMLTAVPWLQGTMLAFAFGLTWVTIGILLVLQARNHRTAVPG